MIKRELYLKRIRSLLNNDLIKVITGIRRCGKTSMLKLIIEELKEKGIKNENIIYMSFESIFLGDIIDNKKLNEAVLSKIEKTEGKTYLFFDEIQNVECWEKSITGFKVDFDCDIYITGSNSTLLSGEFATLLTGRYVEIKIYPFSFNEILQYDDQINHNELTNEHQKELFENYLRYGGLPGLLTLDNNEKMNYLNDIYNSIIVKDIQYRFNIKNIGFFQRLIRFLIENTSKTFSSNSIRKYLKNEQLNLSVVTISNYLDYITIAFLFSRVYREDLKGKNILKISEKYYLTDTGFYTLFFDNNVNYGQLLETIVYNELLRRGYKVTVGKLDKLEIDFTCRKHKTKKYIQVSRSILDEKTEEREFKPLLKIKDSYPKYILTLDSFDLSKEGIIHMNIIDFLKDESI